jgi:ParB family chromosome partitioning protein
MSEPTPKENPLERTHEVRLKDINIGQDNVRHTDAIRDLDELAASIKRHGLLQPILLNGSPGEPPYELISGQRRFLAHQQILKSPTIRAVFAGKLSKTDAVVRSLVENMQRLELEYGDTAKAVTYLYEKFNKDEKAVHRETGLSVRRIRGFILIEARATTKMKTLIRQKRISPSDVKRAIRAAQDDLKKAEQLIELIIKRKPTAHQKRRLVMYGEQKRGASAQDILDRAMEPHVEQNIIISLPEELRKALAKATKSMSMEPEELAAKVLTEWLRDQGFAS